MPRIRLSGIRAQGRHGANAGEREREQPFVVDLDLEVRDGADELAATADYRVLAERVRARVEDTSFVLLESLAAELARAVAEEDRVVSGRVVVHKPRAAGALGVDDVAAEAEVR